MGDETWANIQLVKSKRESFREKIKKRKAERETILSSVAGGGSSSPSSFIPPVDPSTPAPVVPAATPNGNDDSSLECALLECLNGALPPVQSAQLSQTLSTKLRRNLQPKVIDNLLQKFAYKELISITQEVGDGRTTITVTAVQHNRVTAVLGAEHREKKLQPIATTQQGESPVVEKITVSSDEPPAKVLREDKENKNDKDKRKETREDDVMSLLSAQSIRERETKKVGEEIMELLSKPTAKEQSIALRFKSQGGAKVQEFCPHGTKEECERATKKAGPQCGRLHFRKIIQKHTDESLGDCSFLNTCFHMDTCRYVHYEVDYTGVSEQQQQQQEQPTSIILPLERPRPDERTILFPPQWIQCDLRFLDMSILGKFAVIMADPPWDIHMELPYGTMSDDEMRQLNIPIMQDEGLIFLWVTGRAMELGRECLQLWGYERVDEIIWVKTNQLQRIIRTGRTGHWLNHGKEHCLVGMKGNPKINRGLDGDVIVAEVRATSHKPDEIYGIIERLSPGTRKLELFGRPHNVQPNWVTLGNQLEGVNLLEEDLVKAFKERYPDGICRKPSSQ
ncbi:N6-adenosine-methyltransferase subunit METTL3-like isoform X1 [Homarus americanus]|uniref:N6-adenosine-methyltransferase subunit METTL3-like isoform X1 n=1 Tax=Homarus americanus TaxID=6706 RepID=UPI001C47D3BF|nr:N6-adenosine-methyltransferase subunit METTL3-like isoform X1 [Homarus americanus]